MDLHLTKPDSTFESTFSISQEGTSGPPREVGGIGTWPKHRDIYQLNVN